MKFNLLVMACSVLATAASGQKASFVIPSKLNPPARTNPYPFAGPMMRYQQWYSAAEWTKGAKHPVRVVGIAFKTAGSGATKILDLEIAMASGPAFGPSASFNSNLVKDKVVVVPRGKYTLPAGSAGKFVVKFAFPSVRQFVWDGTSPVVVDIKLYDNGNGNKQHNYPFEFTVTGFNQVSRLYSPGSPNQQSVATRFDPNQGITTQFTFEEGVTVSFGKGCPGQHGKVPVASTAGGLPKAGNQGWTHLLTDVRPNRAVALLIGESKDKWGGNQLPLDLSIIKANGCFLYTVPTVQLNTIAVGGIATAKTPIPPVTIFVGFPAFAQWLVLDDQAPNGLMAGSQALWHIIGP